MKQILQPFVREGEGFHEEHTMDEDVKKLRIHIHHVLLLNQVLITHWRLLLHQVKVRGSHFHTYVGNQVSDIRPSIIDKEP